MVLVLLTLFGALPVYRRVAEESPHGEGSIAMLERLLGCWKGKLFVLVLLGFAATDFIITMTLSAADASAHLVENPNLEPLLGGQQLVITLVLLALLGGVFLRGFSEAIGVAVVLVVAYLALNVVVIGVAGWHGSPTRRGRRLDDGADPPARQPADDGRGRAAGVPEAGARHVRVRDRRRRDAARARRRQRHRGPPRGRIRDTKRLLTTAALIMSVFLVTSSLVTTLLIPPEAFEDGGARTVAPWRTSPTRPRQRLRDDLRRLDHRDPVVRRRLGDGGAAEPDPAVPAALRHGSRWARAVRPLVLVLTWTTFVITWIFDADVDAQGGAYATGVLVLFTSARWRSPWRSPGRAASRTIAFAVITAVFAYTTTATSWSARTASRSPAASSPPSSWSRSPRGWAGRSSSERPTPHLDATARSSSATAPGGRSGWSPRDRAR